MNKKVLITGITGQDGALLAKKLYDKGGYDIYGGVRHSATNSLQRLDLLNISNKITLLPLELTEQSYIVEAIKTLRPDMLFHFAAMSFVATSFKLPVYTNDVNALGTVRILDAIRHYSPHTKMYFAGSSEMFGDVLMVPQNETTPFNPRSPYGVSKVAGFYSTKNYRESYQLFTCSGICFNHESYLRGSQFVTKKITQFVAQYYKKKSGILLLGNMEAKRDWSDAEDIIHGIWLMMQQNKPRDYVLASGTQHSIKDFVRTAFQCIGVEVVFDGKGAETLGVDKKTGHTLVKSSTAFYRPADVQTLLGDASCARNQ